MADSQAMQANVEKYEELMRRAYSDDAFRDRLLADPKAVMTEAGFELPSGLEVRAVESSDSVLYLALPPRPSEDLADEQLEQVSGGATAGSAGTIGTLSSIPTSPSVSTAGTIGTAGTGG
jgi:hypothetical protein